MIPDSVRGAIRKYAVKNAIDYGKAEVGSVLGKVIPLAKGAAVPELKREVELAVKEVNALDRRELEAEYEPHRKEFEERAEQTVRKTEKPNLEVEGAEMGKVVTRLPPAPTGYMHIGHMKQAVLSSEIARMYKGRFYRFFDDTDPENCRQEFVDAMLRDHEWLGLRFDKTYYSSDFVEQTYKYAKEMIEKGKAYVCTCEREAMKKKRYDGEECEHRNRPVQQNSAMFQEMLDRRFHEGKAILRYRGDMKALNTVMRDPVLMRIVDTPHYRMGTKYPVWPTYDFNTPIVDSLQGVTDVVRSKEYELHDELALEILKALGLRAPRFHLEARLNIKGNITQKREIKALVEEGRLQGWDDPRLMTIMALRRRGITSEGIRNFVLKLGMTKTDSTVPLEMLLAENKKVIDPIAKHLFFVSNPVRLKVNGFSGEAKLRLHPVQEGFREYVVRDGFYIGKDDAASLERGEAIRLKDLVDAKIAKKAKEIDAEKSMDGRGKIIQWVSEGNFLPCSVVVPGPILDGKGAFNPNSLSTVEGYVESYAGKLKEHEIVQFERFGYCILDDKKGMGFIFISK
jgi:glutamyl-tRNA synthetase